MKQLILIIFALTSCNNEDRFYKKKFDTQFSMTNKTNRVIQEIRIDAYYGKKVWTFADLKQEETRELRFNIKRDIRYPEGSFEITALFSDKDSVTINTGYFTNWGYVASSPSNFRIYDDRIELQNE
jgi:hypothetical protein